MKKRMISSFICLMTTSLLLHTAQAATLIFSPPTGEWNNTNNWGAAALPGTGDTALMNNGRVVSVNSAVGTTAGIITVGNQLEGYTAGMDVNAGGSLNYQGILYMGTAGATGTVNIAGGTLTSVNTGARTVMQSGANSTFNISSGTFTAQGSAATDTLFLKGVNMNISGGTIDMTGGQVVPQGNSAFNITGDAATITMDRLNLVAADRASDWNFTLGANGVSAVDNNAFLSLDYANINVDGSAYTGSGGVIDLFTAPNVASGANLDNVSISGFNPSLYSVAYEQDTSDNYSRLNITAIPEPATLGLITVCGGGLLFIRRRLRI